MVRVVERKDTATRRGFWLWVGWVKENVQQREGDSGYG
jgi:hypothetical protein